MSSRLLLMPLLAWESPPAAGTAAALDGDVLTAWQLLGTGLSDRGAGHACGIVELESTLRILEEAAGSEWAARRDAGLYYVAVFGPPEPAQPGGWRVEGHHLSVNVTDLGAHGRNKPGGDLLSRHCEEHPCPHRH